MLGAFSVNQVVDQAEGCQCPDGEKYISSATEGIFSYLLALGEEGSDNVGVVAVIVASQLATEVSPSHGGSHSDRLLVAEGDSRQRPHGRDSVANSNDP